MNWIDFSIGFACGIIIFSAIAISLALRDRGDL